MGKILSSWMPGEGREEARLCTGGGAHWSPDSGPFIPPSPVWGTVRKQVSSCPEQRESFLFLVCKIQRMN